jgi:hypothetical protein
VSRLGLLVALCGATVIACGDDFEDCEKSRTCARSGDDGNGGDANGSDGNGSDGNGGDVNGGASNGDARDGGAPSAEGPNEGAGRGPADGGAPSGGAGMPQVTACERHIDCSNDDPTDGEELCEQGVCAPGNPPPVVTSVTPADEADDAEPDAPIVIQFSEPVDPATITDASVRVRDEVLLRYISGELAVSGATVTFMPAQRLNLLGSYTISVNATVTDLDGAEMLDAFASSFAVRDGKWENIVVNGSPMYELGSGVGISSDATSVLSWIVNGNDNKYCPVMAARAPLGEVAPAKKSVSAANAVECRTPRAASNEAGVAAVAWERDAGIYVAQYRAGEWSAPELVTTSYSLGQYALAVHSSGVVHLVAREAQKVVAKRTDANGEWVEDKKELTSLGSAKNYELRSEPAMAFNADGAGYVAWRAATSPADGGFEFIGYSRYTANDTWQTAKELQGSDSLSTGVEHQRGAPAVAANGAGSFMVLYVSGEGLSSELKAALFSGEALTQNAVRVDSTDPQAGFKFNEAPALTAAGNDFVAGWVQSVEKNVGAYSARFRHGAGWSTPVLLDKEASAPSLRMPRVTADSHGNVLMVWARARASQADLYDLVSARYTVSAEAWQSAAVIENSQIADNFFNVVSNNWYFGSKWSLAGASNGVAAVSHANRDGVVNYSNLRVQVFH